MAHIIKKFNTYCRIFSLKHPGYSFRIVMEAEDAPPPVEGTLRYIHWKNGGKDAAAAGTFRVDTLFRKFEQLILKMRQYIDSKEPSCCQLCKKDARLTICNECCEFYCIGCFMKAATQFYKQCPICKYKSLANCYGRSPPMTRQQTEMAQNVYPFHSGVALYPKQ